MTDWILAAVVFVLLTLAWCFHRVGRWHIHEAGFWRHIAIAEITGVLPPGTPELLRWSKDHPPSLLERVRGWRPPHERRRRWESS